MKQKLVIFFIQIITLAYSQEPASVWYFGRNAGVKFNPSGTVTTLTDGQLNTFEGSASITDSSGNLLFYTDGMTVYNRNHQVMMNGAGLMGNWSTTQSATIVQKPGSNNLIYIFTLDDFAGVNGLRYSIVDMNLDSGLGAITSDKNILVYAPSSEKLAITKHANGIDYWIVTHGWNSNNFFSHLLTSTGLNPTATVSSIGTVISGSTDNVFGYMKISPDGNKLAVSNLTQNLELYDFDKTNGQITNHRVIYGSGTYGVEFSPNSQLLYASITNSSPYKILQYDLTATNIVASQQLIFNSPLFSPTALQLGRDNKIYVGEFLKSKLSVINSPNVVGSGCNIGLETIDLAGRLCDAGLPQSVQSPIYDPYPEFLNTCVDSAINFNINSIQPIVNATWNFGDGSPIVSGFTPSHTYITSGPFNVSLTATSSFGITTTVTKEIMIYSKPTINSVVTLKQCDDNIDGFSIFNLTEANGLISTNFVNETFSYFETASDAQNNVNPILNPTTYTNQAVSNDVVFVRVANANGCFREATLNLNVSTTQIPLNFTRNYTVCDDAILGTNTDGISSFDFSSVTAQIQAIFPVGQSLVITYYRNLADALAENNAIADITNYRNIGYPNTQNIYIRVDSVINNDCLGLGQHITLNVERIPIVQPQLYNHCDDDQDGNYGFDTTNLQSTLLNGLTGVIVTYLDANNIPLPSPLPNPFVTATQTIKAVVTNNTTTACNYQTTIDFVVDDLPEAFPISVNLTTVCDDEPNPMSQDGIYAFDTSSFQSTILGSQTGMIVNYYDQSNNPLSSPLPNPFATATQNVRVEVINPINNICKTNYIIPFVVNPVPKIDLSGSEIVCNGQTISKTLDAGILDGTPTTNYSYIWKRNTTLLPLETNSTLYVNQEGTYTVEVKNSLSCSRTRTFNVVASDSATITNVKVSDLSNNNTIVVSVSGAGDYVYSLDNITFQASNTFQDVPAGVYNVYVKDLNGCGTTPPYEVNVLGIPSYFTPNGDGYNDYWNIKGISATINANTQIFIFDRLGKLIKQISPISQGWDGTYLGQNSPATDYWYSIQLQDGRIVKGHFALKR